jgi:replication factor A1
MEMQSVTSGAVERISTDLGQIGGKDGGFLPVLQVLSVKKMANNGTGTDRFRLVLSDGSHYAQAMLSSHQNKQVSEGLVKELCLIQITEFIVNLVSGKRLIIIISMDIVGGPRAKIGNPVSFDDGANGTASAGAACGPQVHNSGATPARPPNNAHTGTPSPHALVQNGRAPISHAPTGGGYGSGQQAFSSNAPRSSMATASPYGRPAQANAGVASGAAKNQWGGPARSNGPVQSHEPGMNFTAISHLNPYMNRWTIKARLTSKGEIRHWSNQKGEGYLMSIELLDEAGGEIRGTFFKEAVDKYNPILEEGAVYSVSGGKIKAANKQYNNLNSDYEITFGNDTVIQPLANDSAIKAVQLTFCPIAELESKDVNSTVDVIGIVKDFQECSSIMTKANRETQKRNLTLVDSSGVQVAVTLWGNHASRPDHEFEGNPVVAIKSARVSDYNGRTLSTLNSSSVHFNLQEPEIVQLKQWWESVGQANAGFKSITSSGGAGGRTDLNDVAARTEMENLSGLGRGEKPDYVNVKGRVAFIKHDQEQGPWYTACPTEGCNKKVVEDGGGWHCEKCNRTHPNCVRRYILNLSVADPTGRHYFTAFNDIAQPLLGGRSADQLYELKENDNEEFENIFMEACFKEIVFCARGKMEMVADEQRLKFTILRAETNLDPAVESSNVLKAIEAYELKA